MANLHSTEVSAKCSQTSNIAMLEVPTHRPSESELRSHVAAFLRLGPRHGVASLSHSLRDQDDNLPLGFLEGLIKALCAQNSVWIREFKKRSTRKAKCGARLAKLIGECLAQRAPAPRGTLLTSDDILRRYRQSRSSAVIRIDKDAALGFGGDSNYFLAQLYTLQTKNAHYVDLTVEFNCDHLYVHGLALLAAWSERFASKVSLLASTARVNRYLEITGFKRVVQDQISINAPLWDGENHVALTRVQREDKAAADQVASRLTELFRRSVTITSDQANALTTMFAELVENVYRHAQSSIGSYVMAQAYPEARKLHVVIADTGIGIYRSFKESDNQEVRNRVRTEEKALQMAVEKLVTSKTSGHAGYGLFVVRRLVERNGGQMRLSSGRRSWQCGPTRKGMKSSIIEHLPWTGTEVSLIINLDSPLPLIDVYAELGPVTHGEDFFD